MRYLFILIYFMSLSVGMMSVVAAADKRVALVIGNSTYMHAGDLANPRNDAEDVASSFERVGFKVIKGLDLSKQNMNQLIRKFARSLKGAQIGAFFYAGHGIQVDGKNYLVPIDAKLEDATGIDFELLRVDIIQRAMERTTSSNLIFLDACRNNPLARNLARAMGTRGVSIGRGLATIESGVGTLISFSTQPGNVALDGTGRNSPYAAALAKFLDRPGDNISDILINVRKDVMRATNGRQIPWEHTALTDQIVFVPQSSGGPRQAPIGNRETAYYQQTLKEMQRMREALQRLTEKQSNPSRVEGSTGTQPLAQSNHQDRTQNLASLTHPFDGRWEVKVTSSTACPNKTWKFGIWITDSRVSGGSRIRGGQVDRNGKVVFEHSGKRNPAVILRYNGKIKQDAGAAVIRALGRRCRGVVAMKKLYARRRQ